MCPRITHWGRVTHLCVGKLIIIGSDNGLSPDRRQAIIWTNAGSLSIGPLRTYFSENVIKIEQFSLKKMHVKMSSTRWSPSCLGLKLIREIYEKWCDTWYILQQYSMQLKSYRFSKYLLNNVPPRRQFGSSRPPMTAVHIETGMLSFWWNFRHWLHWKLSIWQLSVQPETKISSKLPRFRFSVWRRQNPVPPIVCTLVIHGYIFVIHERKLCHLTISNNVDLTVTTTPNYFRLYSLAKMEPSIRALNISIRIILTAPISIPTIGTFSCRRVFWQKLHYHPVQDTSSYILPMCVCPGVCTLFGFSRNENDQYVMYILRELNTFSAFWIRYLWLRWKIVGLVGQPGHQIAEGR